MLRRLSAEALFVDLCQRLYQVNRYADDKLLSLMQIHHRPDQCLFYGEEIPMSHAVRTLLLLILVLPFLLPLPARAVPAITCHCFTERTYDAARPKAADPYLLATTQNSFFAIVFNTDKKTIVIKKQQGTPSDDLWIAFWVAARAGLSPEALLQSRSKHGTWRETLAAAGLTSTSLGPRFAGALDARASSARLAESVVDELFLRHRLLPEAELADIRRAGASNQELIIAALLAVRTKQPARKIYLDVKGGSRSWGALLLWADIDTRNMQREVAAILALKPQ